MRLYKEQVRPGTSMGPYFRECMHKAYKDICGKHDKGLDNDYFLLIIGEGGAGKSNLGMMIYEDIDPQAVIEQIAFTQEDCAEGLYNANKDGKRFFMYDEGKINRQNWQDKFYQELLSTYHDIRGCNIFHIWCNVYPEKLPLDFLEARVKGLILIIPSARKDFRRFYFFTKQRLRGFLKQNKTLSYPLLYKYAEKHAFLDSYFTEYNGRLKQEYLLKKDNRMEERLETFKERFGKQREGNLRKISDVARTLHMGRGTVYKHLKQGIESKLLEEDLHYIETGTGTILLNDAGVSLLSETIKKNKKTSFINTFSTEKTEDIPPLTINYTREGEKMRPTTRPQDE